MNIFSLSAKNMLFLQSSETWSSKNPVVVNNGFCPSSLSEVTHIKCQVESLVSVFEEYERENIKQLPNVIMYLPRQILETFCIPMPNKIHPVDHSLSCKVFQTLTTNWADTWYLRFEIHADTMQSV